MKRIAKFEKVSYEQFETSWKDTFSKPTLLSKLQERYEAIKTPERATKFSAGYDFRSPLEFTLKPGETIKIPTGIRCSMNNDWVLMIFPRSGLSSKYRLIICNLIPVIDSDYYYSDNEGHIFIKLANDGDKPVYIKQGDKFVQGIFLPYGITEDDHVEDSRNGGFGSTDKKEE